MTTIQPSKISRCRPQQPAAKCENCSRWADSPNQATMSIARIVNTTGPRDAACIYTPVSRLVAA